MTVMTRVREVGERHEVVAAVEPSGRGDERPTVGATGAGRSLRLLVGQVLDGPDDVSHEVLSAAVRGLEALADASLGATASDARVVLQRRFGRALGRSVSSNGGV